MRKDFLKESFYDTKNTVKTFRPNQIPSFLDEETGRESMGVAGIHKAGHQQNLKWNKHA